MRRVICAALGAGVLLCAPGKAIAAGNGQLAVTTGDRLETLNVDGSDEHAVWRVPREGETIGQLAWSPDGNRIAFVYDDATENARIAAYDLRTGVTRMVSDHDPENAEGALRDVSPGWLADGRIAWRRIPRGTSGGGTLMAAQPDGSDPRTLGLAFASDMVEIGWAPSGRIMLSQNNLTASDVDGGNQVVYPLGALGSFAWSPDEHALVYASGGQLILRDLATLATRALTPQAYPQGDGGAAWAPDGSALVYTHQQPDVVDGQAIGTRTELRMLDVATGAVKTIKRGSYSAAWQPCVAGVTVSCSSPAPPACTPDGAVVIPPAPAPCSLHVGPAPNPPSASLRPAPSAPRLTLTSTPRLGRDGRALVKGLCSDACTVALRLTVRLTSGRVLKGAQRRASAVKALGVVSLRLVRPRIPAHRRVAAAHIVGTISGAGKQREYSVAVKR